MRARPPWRRQAADRIDADGDRVQLCQPKPRVAGLPTFVIAAAAQRRLQSTEHQMVTEVRELLPLGPLDGNSAIPTVTCLQTWLQRHSQRPSARVNE